ncbi:MAG: adenylate/guanylate cyclase domain-containing protein [Aliishimia sp.]
MTDSSVPSWYSKAMTEHTRDTRTTVPDIVSWILQEGLLGTHFEELLETLCEKLVEAGIPLLRVNFSMRAHHPEIGAFAYRWKRASGIIHELYERTNSPSTTNTGWNSSPLKALMDSQNPELRHRLTADVKPFPYPLFDELVEQGATDYFATQVSFERRDPNVVRTVQNLPAGMMASWCSDAVDGFSDTDLASLHQILPALGLALKSNSNYQMAEDLLAAYLGADASARVMSGALGRGSLDSIEAVILYFDLQGFTKLSEVLDGPDIIDLLNDYFGEVVPLIEARGGNVLKFMGDGLLAIFAKDDVPDAELVAVETICDIRTAVADTSTRRQNENLYHTGFTISAHAGDVLYGNIGSASRLDFTVIGPAVNTAARISGMSAMVDQTIVIGANVARPLLEKRDDLVSLGQYRLRGVTDRQELFTLD